MGMFLGEVMGPNSENSFARGFSEQIQPALKKHSITSVAWIGEPLKYFFQGIHDGEPPVNLLSDLVGALGWTARLRYFRNIVNFPGANTGVLVCDMPHNIHRLGSGPSKRCPDNHDIHDDHRVTLCPACGKVLT
jgi:hypothetical protein